MSFDLSCPSRLNGHQFSVGSVSPADDSVPRSWIAGAVRVCNDPTLGISHWICTVSGTPGTWVAQFAANNLVARIPFTWNSNEGSSFPGGGGTTAFTNVGVANRFWIAQATRDWRFVVESSTGQPGWTMPKAPRFWRVTINVNINFPVGAARYLDMVLFKNDDGSTAINALLTLAQAGPAPTLGPVVSSVGALSGWADGDIANISMAIGDGGSVSSTLQCEGFVEFFLSDPTGVM